MPSLPGRRCALLTSLLAMSLPALAVQVELGDYLFDSAAFGDTLLQSDNGSFARSNWLNTVNSDPGTPGALTGADFDTGIHRTYYYGGGGPSDAELFVHEIDLDDYGFAPGTVIHAVSIQGLEQLDLIRVAGVTAAVPEPGTWALMLAGGALLGSLARRRRA